MGIKVNFTDVEVRSFDPLPSGKYLVAISDAEIKESGPQAKNPGSEYINFEFTVQEGDYADKKIWSNASLLPHALFSIKGILDAVGQGSDGELEFELDDLIGQQLVVKVVKKPATAEYDERNEVKGYYAVGGGAGAAAAVKAPASSLP
jgi:hypothetical protein